MQPDYPDTGRETYHFAGGLMTVLVDGAFTSGRYALLLARIPPGNATPPHLHDDDSETLVMLGGAMTAETPGHSVILDHGETAILPPGQVHRLSNSRDEEATYLLLCAPSGFEAFVRRAGTRASDSAALPRQMTKDDVCLMVENAPAYGVRLTDGAELAQSMRDEVRADQRETFVAFGATIEILARLENDADEIVLVRATASSPDNGFPPNRPRSPLTCGSLPVRTAAGTANWPRHPRQHCWQSPPARCCDCCARIACRRS